MLLLDVALLRVERAGFVMGDGREGGREEGVSSKAGVG